VTTKPLTLHRTIALALVVALAERSAMMRVATGPLLGIRTSPEALATAWLWMILIVATITGLALRRRWGAISLIALVPVSTVLLGLPLVPLVTRFASTSFRPYAVMAVNVVLLLAVPTLLRESATNSAATRAH
jgi:hypothetical protein